MQRVHECMSTSQHLLTSRELRSRNLTVPAPLVWLWSFPAMKAALRPLLSTPQEVWGSGLGQRLLFTKREAFLREEREEGFFRGWVQSQGV